MAPVGISHSFDIGIAAQCGVHAALIYNHMCFWISTNVVKEINYHDGHTWTFQTKKQIAAHFSYLTYEQVKLALEKLVQERLLITGNYNSDKFKRDLWYAIPDESILKIETNSKNVAQKGKNPNALGKKPQTLKIINITDTPIPEVIDKSIPSSIGDTHLEDEIYFSPNISAKDKAKGKGKVTIPLEVKADYIAQFGKERYEVCRQNLSNKTASQPRKFKGDYLTLLVFIKNSIQWEEEEKIKIKKPVKKDDFRDFPGNYTMERPVETEVY